LKLTNATAHSKYKRLGTVIRAVQLSSDDGWTGTICTQIRVQFGSLWNLVDVDNKNLRHYVQTQSVDVGRADLSSNLKIVDISIRKSLRRGILACLGLQVSQPRLSSFMAVTIPQMTYAINLSSFYIARVSHNHCTLGCDSLDRCCSVCAMCSLFSRPSISRWLDFHQCLLSSWHSARAYGSHGWAYYPRDAWN